ncbi:MAG: phosphoribosylanthranilate isomerase [Verrucomicrobiota bacterium]|jgi:phosphoribosylanthranilate isomerase
MDVKVKICGLTNVQDALDAYEAEADMFGFMLSEQSPRHISIETAREIARQMPPATMRVAVYVNARVEQVMFALRICDFAGLQFHGDEPPAYCRQFAVKTIKAFRIRDRDSLGPIAAYDTDYILLDSYVPGQPGGTGETFNWDLAAEARELGKPIILAGGLTPENVARAVRVVEPFAVDVSSGVESTPGKKDRQKMRDFVAAVRGAAG